MAKVVSAQKLKQKIDSQENFYLIDVLEPQSFMARHVPTSVNVPFSGDNFVKDFETQTGNTDKNAQVIVYCSSATCNASPQAAEKLEKAGYTNVAHFKDGLAGWQDAGFKFEGDLRE